MGKKLTSIGVVVLALVVALATTSAQTTLAHFDELRSPLLTEEAMRTGQAHLLYVAPETWIHFPGEVFAILRYVHMYALVAMAALLAIVFWAGRRLGLAPGHPAVALSCLASAAIPWAVGRAALAENVVTENAGWWLSLMLLSVLYGALACGILACSRWIRFGRAMEWVGLARAPRAFLEA
jgi:hypothetical protein